MRILFSGGGTTGHVTPAIAIAEYAKKKYGAVEIGFVGRMGGKENDAVKASGYKLYEIEISGLTRKISLENAKVFRKLVRAYRESKKIIKEFLPDIVIGTGGYVCLPVLKAAQKMKIPTFIHESNAYPGLVTRLVSGRCKRVFLNVKEAKEHLRKKSNVIVVGNPVDERFYKTDKRRARAKLGIKKDEFFICSVGGSGGAEKINSVMLEVMEEFSKNNKTIKHIHGTGYKYFEDIKKSHPELCEGKNGVYILPYLSDLYLYMNAADVVISRSGAMTLSELAASATASILIPSPNVTNNHQYENAKRLHEKKAAILIEEKDLTKDKVISELTALINGRDLKETLSSNINCEFSGLAEEKILSEIFNSAL